MSLPPDLLTQIREDAAYIATAVKALREQGVMGSDALMLAIHMLAVHKAPKNPDDDRPPWQG